MILKRPGRCKSAFAPDALSVRLIAATREKSAAELRITIGSVLLSRLPAFLANSFAPFDYFLKLAHVPRLGFQPKAESDPPAEGGDEKGRKSEMSRNDSTSRATL